MATKSLTVTVLHRCAHPRSIEVFCSDDALGNWARIASGRLCDACTDTWHTAWVGTGSRDAMKIIQAEWNNAMGPLTPRGRKGLMQAFPMALPPWGKGNISWLKNIKKRFNKPATTGYNSWVSNAARHKGADTWKI